MNDTGEKSRGPQDGTDTNGNHVKNRTRESRCRREEVVQAVQVLLGWVP